LPAATALALDTCFGTHVLNGTLDEALAAEEESAAVARASQGKSVELPPAALRFATTFAHNRFANASMQYTQQQQQSLSLEEQRHENRQRRLFPTEAFYQSSCGRVAADPHQLVGCLICCVQSNFACHLTCLHCFVFVCVRARIPLRALPGEKELVRVYGTALARPLRPKQRVSGRCS